MRNKPIQHHIWLGGAIPSLDIQRCLASQIIHHGEPEWRIHQWTDSNSPKLTYPLASHAATANVLRLWALYEFGGVFLDADVEVLKPFDPLLEYEAFFARQPDGTPCNAIMGAIPHHPWIKWMLDRAIGEQQYHGPDWACHLIKESPMEGVTELPTELFYPYAHDEDPKLPTDKAYAIHLWEGSWLKH